jgi:hypothetical protein
MEMEYLVPVSLIGPSSHLVQDHTKVNFSNLECTNTLVRDMRMMLLCYRIVRILEPLTRWTIHITHTRLLIVDKDRYIYPEKTHRHLYLLRSSIEMKKIEDLYPLLDRIYGVKDLIMTPATSIEQIEESTRAVPPRLKQNVGHWADVSRALIVMKGWLPSYLSCYNNFTYKPYTPRDTSYTFSDIDIISLH